MIHIENLNGSAQYAGAQNNWESAQWQFQTTSTAKKASVNEPEVMAENNLISIYPNPATNNEFNIVLPELKTGDVATLTITDITGREVLIKKVNTSSAKINHNLGSGIYIVNINSDAFNVSKKLIVK
jgi:hypothetical protein